MRATSTSSFQDIRKTRIGQIQLGGDEIGGRTFAALRGPAVHVVGPPPAGSLRYRCPTPQPDAMPHPPQQADEMRRVLPLGPMVYPEKLVGKQTAAPAQKGDEVIADLRKKPTPDEELGGFGSEFPAHTFRGRAHW